MKNIFNKIIPVLIYGFFLFNFTFIASSAQAVRGCCQITCSSPENGAIVTSVASMSEEEECRGGFGCNSMFFQNRVPNKSGTSCIAVGDSEKTKCLWKELTYVQAKTGCKVFSDYRLDARDDQCDVTTKPNKSNVNNVIKCCCWNPKSDITIEYTQLEPGQYRGGRKEVDNFNYDTPTDPLEYANYNPAVVIGNVIKVILLIIGSIALIMFIYGGFTWMTSFGNESRVATARKVLIWSTLGLFIIFLAYILVGFLLDTASLI